MPDSHQPELWTPLCELRAELDAFAARHAAGRAHLPAAQAARQRLEQALKRLERSAAKGVVNAFHEADWELHRAILAVASVCGLTAAWEAVAQEQRAFSRTTLAACWPDLQVLAEEHHFLVEAILSGDAYAAEDSARAHLDAVWYRLAEAERIQGVALNNHNDPLQQAVAYLAIHYPRPVRLEWLAQEIAQVSPGHLTRLFRDQYGHGFAAYLQELRLNKAADLLCHSGQAIGRIAKRVGYADLSRFGQHFKRRFGTNPRTYRNGDRRSPA
ncbi:MAG: helix-turn-helix domain-containing protein [Planctomycetota bacterium]|jgi:AraC-like DNA-binding protein|nr:helix-turn-helix domain-containing protein [Planctomycetota bacterium]